MNPNEYVKQGNITAAVIDILQSASQVQAFSAINISPDMIGYEAGDRWIQVKQQGGSQKFPQPAHPRVDIIVFAEDNATAIDMIETCKAVMFYQQNQYTGHGLHYISCTIETDTFKSNEVLTNQVRYIVALRIVHKPRN